MSMTENEAKEYIVNECQNTKCRYLNSDNECMEDGKCFEVKFMAIQALEEIQQYRAIGTIEELQALKDGSIPIIHGKAELELHDREIRAKAIDEFDNALINYQSQDENYKSFSDVCYEIAEKLKGVRNE